MASDVFLYQKIDIFNFDVKLAIKNLFEVVLQNNSVFTLYNGEELSNVNDLTNLDYSKFTPLSTKINTHKFYKEKDNRIIHRGQIELAFKNYKYLMDSSTENLEEILIPTYTVYDIVSNQKKLFQVEHLSDSEIQNLSRKILLTVPFETSNDIFFLIKIAYGYMKLYPKSFLVIFMPEEVFFLDDLKRLIEYVLTFNLDLSIESNLLEAINEVKKSQNKINILAW